MIVDDFTPGYLFCIQKVNHIIQQEINILFDNAQAGIGRMLCYILIKIIFNQGEWCFGFMRDIDKKTCFLLMRELRTISCTLYNTFKVPTYFLQEVKNEKHTFLYYFITKYFTYHAVRWDDEPQNPEMQREIGRLVNQRISWSAGHIRSGGNKNWTETIRRDSGEKEKS
jgi:hypothetical protein